MSDYTVVWSRDLEEALADAWMRARDRNAVTEASKRIEMTLAASPGEAGEELSEGLRAVEVPPLRVLFSFSELDRKVYVEALRLIETQ